MILSPFSPTYNIHTCPENAAHSHTHTSATLTSATLLRRDREKTCSTGDARAAEFLPLQPTHASELTISLRSLDACATAYRAKDGETKQVLGVCSALIGDKWSAS